jgi:hydrogenase-4 component F
MQQIVSHSITKSFCFFAAGGVLLTVGTRQIAAVRGLLRKSPGVSAALLFGGLGIAGAPPLAVFLSEFSIFKAGLKEGHFLATGLRALFIVVAFFGVMLHVNRMVFGAAEEAVPSAGNENEAHREPTLPFTCKLSMIVAAIPVLLLGFYIPKPLQDLLTLAGQALTK